jgi:CDGSH-type Zn-finger protein
MENENNTSITPTENGPYMVKGLQNLANRKGSVGTKQTIALCRCGESSNKPFCDGTHAKNGFSSAKLDGRVPDKRDNYVGICAHAGSCTDELAAVFHLNEEPWIHPESATVEEIKETINKCPSGALSYTVNGVEHRDREGSPSIFIAPNGPYVVSGGPTLENTTRAEGASREHFTMCRCGGSKNKPFCDGSHWNNDFKDDKN